MCKNCKCQECNPPPKPSISGTVTAANGTPFEFHKADLVVFSGEYEEGMIKFRLDGRANLQQVMRWLCPTSPASETDTHNPPTR